MKSHQALLTVENAELIALRALAYIAGNERLGPRLLALTGLDAQTLRERAGTKEVLGATLEFLAANETDLVACAEAIDCRAEDIARAHSVLL